MPQQEDQRELLEPAKYGYIYEASMLVTASDRLSRAVRKRLGDEVCAKIEQEIQDADECRSIKATLCVNCQPGRVLHNLGCVYDEKKSVHTNLIGILEKLTLGNCER